MPLRQLARRSATLIRDGLHDRGLLEALRSELAHELSFLSSSRPPDPSQSHQVGSLVGGGFTLEWDDPRTQDVVLRRRHGEAGDEEEVAVSAVLAPLLFHGEHALPRDALMKVCLKKPGSDPVLHFDCRVFNRQQEEVEGGGDGSDFAVRGAYYRPSMDFSGAHKYMGPSFSSLDPQLQQALKDYLVTRGIGMELTSFLLRHLHTKEHLQYVNWLRTLEGVVAKDA